MIDAEFQAASLAIREWALWVAMAQVAISAIQTGIVYYGIRAMVRATNQRGRDAERDRAERAEAAERDRKERAEAAAEARRDAERDRKERAEAAERDRAERAEAAAEARREADRRHAESMAAIKALIEGQAQTNATLAANTATLAEATAALKLVVERAASGAAPASIP